MTILGILTSTLNEPQMPTLTRSWRHSSPSSTRLSMNSVAPSDHPLEDVMVDDVGLSDHMLVSRVVNLALPLQAYVTTTHPTWRTFKIENFISRLMSLALCMPDDSDSSINHLTEQNNAIITDLLDEMVPSKTVTLWEQPKRPRYDDDCRR